MRRPCALLHAVLPLALAAAAPSAFAGEVYVWKDARGVTHYSDAPPPGRTHTTRAMESRPAPAARPVVNSDCSNARANLSVLEGAGKVGADDDRDGKPDRELTAAERTERLARARRQIEVYCEGRMRPAPTGAPAG